MGWGFDDLDDTPSEHGALAFKKRRLYGPSGQLVIGDLSLDFLIYFYLSIASYA